MSSDLANLARKRPSWEAKEQFVTIWSLAPFFLSPSLHSLYHSTAEDETEVRLKEELKLDIWGLWRLLFNL